MFEKIEGIIEKTFKLIYASYSNFEGMEILDKFAELYCLNNFSFIIHDIDVGRIKENPLSPFKRFGLDFYEALEFSALMGFVLGAIANELGRTISEIELKHLYKYLDKSFKKRIEKFISIDTENIKEEENEDGKNNKN